MGRRVAPLACAAAAALLACSRAGSGPGPAPATPPDAGPAGVASAAAGAPGGATPGADGGAAAGAGQARGPDGGGPLAPDAGPTAALASPSGPVELPLSSALAVVPGQELPLSRSAVTVVDPAATFRVEVGVALVDGRLALHDGQDAMVPSEGTTEVGPTWTRFALTPQAPLRPGSAYVLELDGADSRNAHDQGGRAYAPVHIALKTSGERPAPPARKPRGR